MSQIEATIQEIETLSTFFALHFAQHELCLREHRGFFMATLARLELASSILLE